MIRETDCIVPIPTRGQALEQVRRVVAQTGKYPSGICRFCGCTELSACEDERGEPCGWQDATQTVCDALPCLKRYSDEQFKARTSGQMGGTA